MRFALALLVGMAGLSASGHAAYVQLDAQGQVVAVFHSQQSDIPGLQNVPDDDPKISAFRDSQAKAQRAASGDQIRRLTDLLVAKKLITDADQATLLNR